MSRSDKEAVLSLVRRTERRRPVPPVLESPAILAKDFSELPVYQTMMKQRVAADMLGLENPFFRVHEGPGGPVTRINGADHLNFASYDYLGLNRHAAVSEAAHRAALRFGTSASASRIVAGERPLHGELERALAAGIGVPEAVVFVSGHATNVAAIGELMGERDLIVYDALIHNSIVAGARLSGARRRSFPHNDLSALEAILAESRRQHENCLVVVESVYSMDGDTADLPRLIEIKRRHGAWLMVDEAHALGVLGERGHGSAEHFGVVPGDVDIWMGTLSKTLASCGGYIAGSRALVEMLKFRASGFVYSVGLAPPLAAAALEALRLMTSEPERVQRMRENGRFALETARSLGLDTGHGEGYSVLPVMVGDSLRAAMLTQRLLERHINVLPIVYPAVPMQSARLRFFIVADHTRDQIGQALRATKEELDQLVAEGFSLESIPQELIDEAQG